MLWRNNIVNTEKNEMQTQTAAIREALFALQDEEYAAFHRKLVPGMEEKVIGVRVPDARKLAKTLFRSGQYALFLNDLPHTYNDENLLHALLVSEIKDYSACLESISRFLPYINNWAVCDILSPKVFKKHKPELLSEIRVWSASRHTYTCRFGLEMLMTWFLDDDFRPEYLDIPLQVRSEDYYVNMMLAWFFATALAKQWEAVLPCLTENRLSVWVHNKTIQKARESFRITPEQKAYLSTLKR